jgi:hypothetical protein
MTPKEKSRDLVEHFTTLGAAEFVAKQCALIVVEEVLNQIDWHPFEEPSSLLLYWNDVKEEIEKL